MTFLAMIGAGRAPAGAARPEAAGAASAMPCPARLATDQSASAPPGWSAQRLAKDAPLEAISIYDGPPADRVELKPSVRRLKGWEVTLWLFDREIRPMIACRYRGTDVALVQALPATVRQCSLRTRAGTGLIDPAALRCR